MNLDIALGNIPGEEADRLGGAAITPFSKAVIDVTHEHAAGTAEPWISRLVHTFILASGAKSVLETGSFLGGTSTWIVDALTILGGGRFTMCEIDAERRAATVLRLRHAFGGKSDVTIGVEGDVIEFLRTTQQRFDLAWVDDDHTKQHVRAELHLLYPKMNPGGIILGHDVWGSCDLQEVFRQFGGYALDLPRLGAAGGLGIIQIPVETANVYWRGQGSERALEGLLAAGAKPL